MHSAIMSMVVMEFMFSFLRRRNKIQNKVLEIVFEIKILKQRAGLKYFWLKYFWPSSVCLVFNFHIL